VTPSYEGDRAGIEVGADRMRGLMAYPGPDPVAALLQDAGEPTNLPACPPARAKSARLVEVQA